MSRGTIVLAVFDPDTRELLTSTLKRAQYSTVVARSVSEVLESMADANVVLADAGLPENGAMRLLENQPTVPVLIVLLRSDETAMSRYLNAGATDVIARPVLSPELVARVGALVRLSKSESCLESERKDFDLLLDITRTLASRTTPESILEGLVEKLSTYLSVERASIILVSRDPNYGYAVASSESEGVGLQLDLRKYPEVGRTLASRKVLIVEDVASSKVLKPLRKQLMKAQVKSLLALPIAPEGEPAATLLLHTRGTKRKFTRQEVRLCAAAAEAAGFALRNARVFRAIRG